MRLFLGYRQILESALEPFATFVNTRIMVHNGPPYSPLKSSRVGNDIRKSLAKNDLTDLGASFLSRTGF